MTKKNVGAGAGSEMESLGHLGSKKEKVAGGGKAPIFELRRMRQSVPSTDWNALAMRVYDFIVATDQGGGNVRPAY